MFDIMHYLFILISIQQEAIPLVQKAHFHMRKIIALKTALCMNVITLLYPISMNSVTLILALKPNLKEKLVQADCNAFVPNPIFGMVTMSGLIYLLI